MKHRGLVSSTVLASVFVSTTALADVTAEQIWQNWHDMVTISGQTLTAESQSMSGDTLTVTGIRIATEFEGARAETTLDTVTFRERGDGTVLISVAPEYPLSLTITLPDETATTINMLMRQSGLIMVASGSDTETSYDYSADEVSLELTDIQSENASTLPAIVSAISFNGITGNSTLAGADILHTTGTQSIDSMVFDLAVTEAGKSFAMYGRMENLAAASTMSMPDLPDITDTAAMLKAGFRTELSFTYGTNSYTLDFADGSNRMHSGSSAESGFFNLALDKTRWSFGGGITNGDFTESGTRLPIPEVNVSFAEVAFNLLVPVSKSDAPGNFAFLTRLTDFSISEDIWAMLDPAAMLPRDPLNLVIDLKGKANWLIDILAPDVVAAASSEMPAQLHALDISEIRLSAAGADLTGNGGFTFDNSDLVTFGGMPAPTGKLDLQLVGGNGLMDTLGAMGLLPDDQAMMARMMLGLFARPGEGADTLTSTVEFKDGTVFANGQRIQ